MKILIISDSHGRRSGIKKALDAHPDAQLLLFLGDGIRDIESAAEERLTVYSVRGNCDTGFIDQRKYPAQRTVTVMGKTVFMCHGNSYGVGGGSGAVVYAAMEAGAHICLYGHTHVKQSSYLPDAGPQGLYLFNPGSITLPRDCMTPSYGILDIRENGVLLSHGFIQ